MKKSYSFLRTSLLACFLSFGIFCNGQSQADKIEELLNTYVDYGKFNGAVLVAKQGEVIYKKGFGLADMEWGIPNGSDTKFRLASVTKQFTAMLIMQLVAENKLALEEPISSYLPEYPKEKGDRITIHHLLTHTSGIPNYTSFPDYRDRMRNPVKPAELLDIFADSTLQFSPGERFNYSNSGYALLGFIIEQVTGESYEKNLQKKILEPLNMNNTGLDNGQEILKNRAAGYHKNGSVFVNSGYINMSIAYSAGGMYSTVEDMFLWDQALYSEQLLPKKYMDMIFEKHTPAWGQHYGYGWITGESTLGNSRDRVPTIEHDGVINGFTALIFRFPTDRSSIIFLNNTGGAPLYEMSKAISGILYDKPYDFPKISMAYSMLEIIKKEGLKKGLAFFENVKDSNDYFLDENEMNQVGYELLQSNQAEKAKVVFKLNMEAHPNSSNVYDSYGEALMVLGDKEEAIKNYKKSLTLNPRNENGIVMLKKLGVEIDENDLYLLNTGNTWAKEIFTFPLRFAKTINYEGIEEAHFPGGWRDPNSPEFWSYIFAWNVNLPDQISKTDLTTNLGIYFDGLMNVVNRDKNLELPGTIVNIHEKDTSDDIPVFTGTLKIYDAFVTKEAMTLNVLVEQHFCVQKKQSILLFRFSPKGFDNDIWLKLKAIKLRDNKCED